MKMQTMRLKTKEALSESGWQRNVKSTMNAYKHNQIIPNMRKTVRRESFVKYHGGGISEEMLPFLGKKVKVRSHRHCGKHLIFQIYIEGQFEFVNRPQNSIELHSSAFRDEDVENYMNKFFYLETTYAKKSRRIKVTTVSFKSFMLGDKKVTANHLKQMVAWLKFQGMNL